MQSPRTWARNIEPKSYEQIYAHVRESLQRCSASIDQLETDYYQGVTASSHLTTKPPLSKRPLSINTLLTWSRPLNELRNARSMHDIRNGKAIRDLLAEAKARTLEGPVSDESCYLIQRILDKTNEQLHHKMPDLANKISDCMSLMEKYFLSFYEIENIQAIIQKKKKENPPDEYIETAYTYEKSRRLHLYHVNRSLKILREMQQRVEDARGIILSTLSKECQELAARCDCSSLSYIFALPECYTEARRAILALQNWLSEDERYTSFVYMSLKTLDEKYNEAKKSFDFSKAHHSQAEHRVDGFHAQLELLEQESQINEKKLVELENRFDEKERDYLSKRLTYEVYEDQLKKMIKEAEDKHSTIDNHLSIERFQHEIQQFLKELPKLSSQIKSIHARIEFLKQRREELKEKRSEFKKLERELQLALEDKILKENELNRVMQHRQTMRDIYRCRATNDLPQKIFYDLPLKPKNSPEEDNDDLSKALRITAKYIGRDWNRLYWQLPFYPSRGKQEISKDISHFDEKHHRGDIFRNQATDALNKWRRYHTRAKLDDLIHALQQIRRYDIVQLINRHILQPKRLLDIEPEEIDPRKLEIETLNRKLNRLFEKMHSGAIVSHETS